MGLRHLLGSMIGEEGMLARAARVAVWMASVPPKDYLDFKKRRLFRTVRPYTMVGYRRLANVYEACREAARLNLPGAFVECGVWKGGAAALMAWSSREAGSKRMTWMFDSFAGLPEASPKDDARSIDYAGGRSQGRLESIGRCIADVRDVERVLFDVLRLDRATVAIRKGWFQDTLPQARREIGSVAVLRIDGDWYESTKVCFDNLYDNVVEGGFILLDDYGHWEGSRRATDEFLAARGVKPEMHRVDHTGHWFRKPGSKP